MAVLASKKKKTSTKQKLSKRHTRTPTRGMAILVPRARVPLDQRSGNAKSFAFLDRWSRGTRALGTRMGYGHYLAHAQSYITRAVATMDSCFVLVGTHQQNICTCMDRIYFHSIAVTLFYRFLGKPSHTVTGNTVAATFLMISFNYRR